MSRRTNGSFPVFFSFNKDLTSSLTSWSSDMDSERMVLIIFLIASFRLRKAWRLTSRSILFRSSSSILTGTMPIGFHIQIVYSSYWLFGARVASSNHPSERNVYHRARTGESARFGHQVGNGILGMASSTPCICELLRSEARSRLEGIPSDGSPMDG